MHTNTSVEDITGEQWKPIPDYEKLYEISNKGRVKSLFAGKTKILKQTQYDGYLKISLNKSGTLKTFRVNRLVAIAFLGDITDMEVDHLDRNRENNNLENLKICTRSENDSNRIFPKRSKSKIFSIKQLENIINKNGITDTKILLSHLNLLVN